MKLNLILTILLIGIILVSGCTKNIQSGTTGNLGEVKVFNSVIQNYRYNPESINVNFGDTVRVNIKNNDGVTHGISLPIFGVNEFVRPGQTKTIQFVANQRGNPETFCSTDHGEKLLIQVSG